MAINWRKSSYSGSGNTSDCVEVALLGGKVGVRDGKDPSRGHLVVGLEAVRGLVGQIKAGKLDL